MDNLEGGPPVFPRARTDNLTIRVLPEETLVYDQERHKAHCLNTPASLVWRHCDGKTSVPDLARILGREMGIIEPDEVVGLALEQLGRRRLLEEMPQPLPAADRIGRREVLKKLAIAAITLPLVMTVTTRTAAQTISDPSTSSASSVQPPVSVQVTVQGSSKPSTPAPAPTPCRTKGQSCLASTSGQQGTCCSGLACNGVAQGAGICG
jgi:hypothetical protein